MPTIFDQILQVDKKLLKKVENKAKKIDALSDEMRALSDEELKAKTPYFKERLANGETLDDILVEAFAVAREACYRVRGEYPFFVQLMGAIVLHEGDIAEMKTGEGKTLTSVMPAYLNALSGKGVHIVTVNEYLVSVGAENMGKIHEFLGLTVGMNMRALTPKQKKAVYDCDIMYTTNAEVGFDYLRDNMVTSVEDRVMRPLNYAIVDEVDSILIDESRTPLIISGGARNPESSYKIADTFVKTLRKDKHYTIDLKSKTCSLTEDGNAVAERMFGIKNLYDPEYNGLVHRIVQALKANYIMTRDVEYMVDRDGEIQLIDQNTGRILKGREYSDGLQQAIQAKENVKIKEETFTMATITYQNFFRLYTKLSGMTGTAKTEEEEFRKIYNMRVVTIPTNRPVIRVDDLDLIFARKEAKLNALVAEIKRRHELGQPILVGTVSVESSEVVSNLLIKAGLPHEVLNAKNHEREAEIIKHAGEKGAITIATNMAGRGTDIKIDDEVKALGGLCVFGTERHESRRIDNQLRGRSGRQGDPGYSRFYVSFEDDLMLRFVSDNIRNMFIKMGDEPITSRIASSTITNAQKQIEGQNFDTRKSLLDYDDVMRQQREIMYKKRDKILLTDDIADLIEEFFNQTGLALSKKAIPEGDKEGLINGEEFKKILVPRFVGEGEMKFSAFDQSPYEEAGEDLSFVLKRKYDKRRQEWGDEVSRQIEKQVALRCIDRNWTNHIDTIARLREGIHLRSYAQRNPLQDYVNEGFELFNKMLETVAIEVVLNLLNVTVNISPVNQENSQPQEEDKKE